MEGVVFIVIVVFLVPIIVLVVFHNRISKVEHDLKILFNDVAFLKQQFFKTDTYSEIAKQHNEARAEEKKEHFAITDEIKESVDPAEINIPAMVEPVSEFTYNKQNDINEEIPDTKVERELPTVDIPQEHIPFINETPSKIKRAGRRTSPTPNKRRSFSSTKTPTTPAISNLDIKKNNARTKKITAMIPCLV